MKARDQFGFASAVERRAVGLRDGRREKQKKPEDLRHRRADQIPARQETPMESLLRQDDLAQVDVPAIRMTPRRTSSAQVRSLPFEPSCAAAHHGYLLLEDQPSATHTRHGSDREEEEQADIQVRDGQRRRLRRW